MSGPIPSADDLLDLVERLESGLIGRVTNRVDEVADEDYKRIRRLLIGHPHLEDILPSYLKTCRSTGDVWHFINSTDEILGGQGVWQARRAYIRQSFAPIIERLEGENIDLLGPYEQVGLLGRGGFGEVYEYRDRRSGSSFAIKFFNPAFAEGGEPGFLERFLREARILRALRHPQIIEVYESGQHGRRPFIRMECFRGRDLNQHLREHGVFSPDLALRVVRALATGLAHAHAMGIVHRDLKPSNIMTARPDQLRIIDFGLGAYVEHELVSRITRTGQALVGGHYTAPELVASPRLLDTRSDVYSVGAIWYELVLGRPPAGSRISDTIRRADVPHAETEVMLHCLADSEDRYPSATELLAALPTPAGPAI